MSDRLEWLRWRQGGLGGSDIGAIFGVSRWRGPWDVYTSKTETITADRAPDRSQRTGQLLEEAVGKWASAELGAELIDGETRIRPGEHWMRGSTDYWLEADGERTGLECKTAERPDDEWGATGTDQIPASYALQVRWYMAVFDAPSWVCAVFFKRTDEWRWYRLERDLEGEAAMVARAATWWLTHIVDGVQLAPDDSDGARRGLALRHPCDDRGDLRVATLDEEQLVRDYRATQIAIAELMAEKRRLGNILRAAIGAHGGLRFTGGRIKWSRPSSRLTVTIRD